MMAVALFDADSLPLGEFAHQRLTSLDKAWGRAIYGHQVGNPRERGEVYERLCGPELLRRDEAGALRYEKLVQSRGSELNHVLREMEVFREYFGVSRSQLPAFIFWTFPARPKCLVLPIAWGWLASEYSRLALSRALQECLAEERVLRLITPGETTTYELEQGLQRLLNEMVARMRRFSSRPATSSQRPARQSMSINQAARTRDLVIDTTAHRVLYKRKELHLPALLFKLNLVLAERASQGSGWVKRVDLEDALWPEDVKKGDFPRRYRIDDAMNRLRRAYLTSPAMSSTRAQRLFPSRRNVGYRMELPSQKIAIL